MPKTLLIVLLAAICFSADAQQSSPGSCIGLSAYHAMNDAAPGEQIPVYIKGDVPALAALIKQYGGTFKFAAGDIISATLDRAAIRAINESGLAVRIEANANKGNLLNDVMVLHNNVDSAFYGYWPLEQAYDGTGVVVGIIDAPFDLDHGDFTDADGNSRIKYVWDQNITTGAPPTPYGYGVECDSAMIADGTCPSVDDDPLHYSHGSGVTGVAASSGMASNHYRGVAPNADLILVSMDFENDYETNATDAIAYIYAKAAEMGKPCVINTSFGSYAGSHDGSDLMSQTIDALITASPGRALVAAAGNAGNNAFHLGYDVTATEQFTWFKKLSYMNLVYFQLWADTADFNQVDFRLSVDEPAGFTSLGSTPYFNMLSDFDFTGDIIDSVTYSIPGGGNITIYAQLDNDKYFLEFVATPSVPGNYWRLSTVGSGHFDIWSAESTTGFSNYVTTGLPSAVVLPEIVNYRLPDTDQTIVSSFQCSDHVITVGSYVNRDSMTNFYLENPPFFDVVGALFYSSSHGPTRDGRIKPDICAPGARVLSTASDTLTEWLALLDAATYVSADAQHYLYNGTSFSSPAVAGIAALYLQKNPNATAAEIKDAILSQARKDDFTGAALPNNLWGYGKADAFRTLTGDWGCAADDYTEPPVDLQVLATTPTKAMLDWDIIPNAAGYQIWYKSSGGSWNKLKSPSHTKTISGLTPNTTYNAKVRSYCTGFGFSDFSTTITFTTPPLREDISSEMLINVYPNPASNILHVDGVDAGSSIVIVNMLGQVIYNQTTTNAETNQIDIHDWAEGMYRLLINEHDNYTLHTFIVAR